MLDEATVEQFKTALRGELIQPGDPSYNEARQVYNGMIDKRPQMIARCSDVADVISCVNFAKTRCSWPSAVGDTTAAAWAPATTGL